MNDEDQEVPLYYEIFQYLKHGEYRVDASKSEKLPGDSQESTQFRDEGRLALSQKQYGRHDRKAMDCE